MSFENELIALQPRLLRFSYKFTRNLDAAEDLTQETMLLALKNKDKFKEGTNLTAWTYTIMRNAFLTQMRKSYRTVEDPDEFLALALVAPSNQFDTVVLKELAVQISLLPPAQIESLMLVTIEGLTYEDAAHFLKVRPGTVKSRVARARDALRQATGMYDDNLHNHLG